MAWIVFVSMVLVAAFFAWIVDQARMRRERYMVCMAIVEALEACPKEQAQAANSLALDFARRLNEKGWNIEL